VPGDMRLCNLMTSSYEQCYCTLYI